MPGRRYYSRRIVPEILEARIATTGTCTADHIGILQDFSLRDPI
jgi:hypothetical protein